MIKKLNIYEILEHLQKHKQMYLGADYTFQSLDAFLGGFLLASSPQNLHVEGFNSFSDFNVWILGHLPAHVGCTKGWYWQIKNHANNNDEYAFEVFFDALNLFKTAKKYTELIDVNPFRISNTINNGTKHSKLKFNTVNTIHKIQMEHSSSIWIKGFHNDVLIYESWCMSLDEFNAFLLKQHQ